MSFSQKMLSALNVLENNHDWKAVHVALDAETDFIAEWYTNAEKMPTYMHVGMAALMLPEPFDFEGNAQGDGWLQALDDE